MISILVSCALLAAPLHPPPPLRGRQRGELREEVLLPEGSLREVPHPEGRPRQPRQSGNGWGTATKLSGGNAGVGVLDKNGRKMKVESAGAIPRQSWHFWQRPQTVLMGSKIWSFVNALLDWLVIEELREGIGQERQAAPSAGWTEMSLCSRLYVVHWRRGNTKKIFLDRM